LSLTPQAALIFGAAFSQSTLIHFHKIRGIWRKAAHLLPYSGPMARLNPIPAAGGVMRFGQMHDPALHRTRLMTSVTLGPAALPPLTGAAGHPKDFAPFPSFCPNPPR